MLLAIDTATQYTSFALHDGKMVLAESSWAAPVANHSTELAPAIQSLLARCAVPMDRLTLLAVSVGPGSYTGLRVGVALAKGLASALSLPLIGISALDVLALGQPQTSGTLLVLVQAGRGRVVAGAYHWRKGRWKRRSEPLLMTWEQLIASIDGAATITGEIDSAGLTALENARSSGLEMTIVPPPWRVRRAAFLAEEAWSLYREQPEGWSPAAVLPVYVKTKDLP
jgi:tRNA threonylcarbamoyladenosine biosynthesis protein TsaB